MQTISPSLSAQTISHLTSCSKIFKGSPTISKISFTLLFQVFKVLIGSLSVSITLFLLLYIRHPIQSNCCTVCSPAHMMLLRKLPWPRMNALPSLLHLTKLCLSRLHCYLKSLSFTHVKSEPFSSNSCQKTTSKLLNNPSKRNTSAHQESESKEENNDV